MHPPRSGCKRRLTRKTAPVACFWPGYITSAMECRETSSGRLLCWKKPVIWVCNRPVSCSSRTGNNGSLGLAAETRFWLDHDRTPV